MWKLPDNTILHTPQPITQGINQYPKSIFKRWSKEELADLGILPFHEVPFNTRRYRSTGFTDTVVDGVVVREHTLSPKQSLDDLKAQKCLKIKQRAQTILKETDWLTLRELEEEVPIPAELKQFRKAVRKASNDAESRLQDLEEFDDVFNFQPTELDVLVQPEV